MPKLIDHPKQKQAIAEAAWRVILQQGMHKASARTIAKEAGLSLGAMRYYFSAQNELLAYANQLVHARLGEKIDSIFQDDVQPKEKIFHVLLCLLPLEEGQVLETSVRLSLKVAALHDVETSGSVPDAAYSAAKNVISYLALLNLLPKNADLEIETERLSALVDGLVLKALANPAQREEAKIKRVLQYHLDSICTENFSEAE
ncbi:MAG TPA: TetR family transcriptional regulator C-terminal domain-containing protein [Planococcus sp. (in: firmicutes)]|nr:TetR family transcriptional regulator C-terminal domain-containing protein [Planococcus sp. (in: firmicutes)]